MFEKLIAFLMASLTAFLVANPWIGGNRNNVQPENNNLVKPETWAMTDGLGRTAPLKGEVREENNTKFVGLFYWTWHTEQSAGKTVYNTTQLLKNNPSAVRDFNNPLWESPGDGYPHFWDEPLYGYYVDTDAYVLRKQAELIADAGVDVIFFDCTNSTLLWKSSYDKLFEIFTEAREDGVNVPQIAFILPFFDGDDCHTDLVNLYNDIYGKGRYRDLWFMWDGKPLILCNPNCLNKANASDKVIADTFTFRTNEAEYFVSNTLYNQKTWGWCSVYPQTKFGISLNRRVEQMCVSVAQNAADGKLSAMNADADVQGRGYSEGNYSYSYRYGGKTVTANSQMENAYLYGINFQQQWDYALKCDPNFIFVTGWNEWIAGRFKEWEGTENAFPDQFNYEFSRDCEPSAGIQKDYYYCQLAENIRRFKGISAETPEQNGTKTYYHYADNTYPRNNDGWSGYHYNNNTMRNDFVKAEVKNSSQTVTFTVYTEENITPYTDKAWMRILIDTDTSGVSPNWEGFEYILNRQNATENTLTVEKSAGGWNFAETGTAQYTVAGNKMTVTVPLSALGLSPENVHFNFKLSDNMQTDGDIMDFYLNGDVAPGSRYTFVY